MKKFKIIYILPFVICVFLLLSMKKTNHRTITFYGFAENKETNINMENPIEVKKIYVTTGQKVKKGDVLLDVISSDLPLDIQKTFYKIEELKTKYNLWQLELNGNISQLQIELQEKTNAIQSKIDEFQFQLSQNKVILDNLESALNEDIKTNTSSNPIKLRIKALKRELRFSRSVINKQIENLKNELEAENNPILSQIKSLENEMEYYDNKSKKLSILAPSDGLIGTIHCKQNEKIDAFNVLITFYDESPKQVIGYVHEDLMLQVNINDTTTIFSSSRPDISSKGVVVSRGSRIIEIPSRLRKFKDFITYGREIIIELPSNNSFLQKEKVTLNLTQ